MQKVPVLIIPDKLFGPVARTVFVCLLRTIFRFLLAQVIVQPCVLIMSPTGIVLPINISELVVLLAIVYLQIIILNNSVSGGALFVRPRIPLLLIVFV